MSYSIRVIVADTAQLLCEAEQDVFFPCISIVIYYIADKTGQDKERQDKARRNEDRQGKDMVGKTRQD